MMSQKEGRQKEFVDAATKQYDTTILFNSVSNNMGYKTSFSVLSNGQMLQQLNGVECVKKRQG